jgi:TonB family protein
VRCPEGDTSEISGGGAITDGLTAGIFRWIDVPDPGRVRHRRVASNSLGSSCGCDTSILQESCRASSGMACEQNLEGIVAKRKFDPKFGATCIQKLPKSSSTRLRMIYADLMSSGWRRAAALTAVLCFFGCCSSRAQETEGSRKIVTRVTPQYPGLARGLKLQGSVKVEVMVAPDGSARTVEIKGGHPLLAQAAHDAIQKWKWAPAATETHELIEVKFNP